jgi:putative colanic acid biosynthesis acetyltransferase WcaF
MDGVTVWMPWNLEMDSCSVLGRRVEIYNFAKIVIGQQTVISQDVYLCTASHDYEHPHMPLTCEPIFIGAQSWIASGAFVGPGVHIGNGAVIGARSVVTKDMPEWMVCAGNPCQPLKRRIVKHNKPSPFMVPIHRAENG